MAVLDLFIYLFIYLNCLLYLLSPLTANCSKRKLSVCSIQTTRAEIHQETPRLSTGQYKVVRFLFLSAHYSLCLRAHTSESSALLFFSFFPMQVWPVL